MTGILEGRHFPFGDATEVEPEAGSWLLTRLAVRSVALLGLLAALLVVFVHAFIHLCFRTTRE